MGEPKSRRGLLGSLGSVDENTPVILEVPKIEGGRYYSWQMLNGWGETVLNINERTFPDHPFGKYALVLKGSNPPIPEDALRVELPSRKSRVLARVELGSDPEEAIRLQKQFKLTPTGTPEIAPLVVKLDFPNDKLPGAEAFDQATAIIESEPDINPGMEPLQAKVRAVEALVKSGPDGKARVANAIETLALPQFKEKLSQLGVSKNGWTRPSTIGNYGEDYLSRTAINLIGIWANNTNEVVYFKTNSDGTGTKLDGGNDLYDHLSQGCTPAIEGPLLLVGHCRRTHRNSRSSPTSRTAICSTSSLA